MSLAHLLGESNFFLYYFINKIDVVVFLAAFKKKIRSYAKVLQSQVISSLPFAAWFSSMLLASDKVQRPNFHKAGLVSKFSNIPWVASPNKWEAYIFLMRCRGLPTTFLLGKKIKSYAQVLESQVIFNFTLCILIFLPASEKVKKTKLAQSWTNPFFLITHELPTQRSEKSPVP